MKYKNRLFLLAGFFNLLELQKRVEMKLNGFLRSDDERLVMIRLSAHRLNR